MPTVVGVRLRPAGKVLTFEAAGTTPEPGDVVVVSTERGEEIGEVAIGLEELDEQDVTRKLKPILRIATERDLQIADELREKEIEAMRRYRELIGEHELDMKPVSVEALFDGRKMVFYFTAEERVDFRDLVRDLAREFKTRVDMRQIGVRDEARMVGGIGHCGQQLCCVRFGGDFEPVSIRMAKAQDLPLNPLKISGLCGRLMCCLRYEYETYKDFKSRAPKYGARIETPRGEAKVVGLDAPRETVTLLVEKERLAVPLDRMSNEGCPSHKPCKVSGEVLDEIIGASRPALLSSLESAGDTKKDRPSKKRRRRPRSSGEQASDRDDQKKGAAKSESGQGGSGSKSGRKRSGKKRRRGSRGGSGKSGGQATESAKGGSQQRAGASSSGGSQKSGAQKGGSQKSGSTGSSGSGSSGRRRRRRRPRSDGDGSSPKSS